MKKWLFGAALLLTLVCVICAAALPTRVEAATYGDLTYTISNGEVTIADCNTSATGELVIPETIEGYPVTSIGDSAFWGCRGITGVKIPNSVKSIGTFAFTSCTSLESITIPDSVETIGSVAFESCYALTDVVLSKNLKTIEYNTFWGCSSLTNITIPASVTKIGSAAFYNCTGLTGVYISDVAAWVNIAFGNEKANPLYYAGKLYLNEDLVTDMVIPDGVKSIGAYAFCNNTALTSAVIPTSVESIGKSAFTGCSKLESLTLPFVGGSATENTFLGYIFGADGFSFNSDTVPTSLKSVIIAEGCADIGDKAFYGCYALTNVELANSVKTIGHYAFQDCRGLTEITIADGVTEIGADAFRNCTGLIQITFGKSVSRIGSGAFKSCTGLDRVTIPESLTYIGEAAFEKCTALTKVNVSDIDAWAQIQFVSNTANPLFYAKKLYMDGELVTGVVLSDDCTKIGDYAFRNCADLTGVVIPDSVTGIGRDAFYNCAGLTGITIPDSIETVGRDAFYGCTGLTRVSISDIAAWAQINFGLYTANPLYTAQKLYLNGELVAGELQLDNCESIGSYAFAGCIDITGVVLPEEMVSIGEGVFFGCAGLTDITIPKGIVSVENETFNGCISLTNVTIPEGVTSIGARAFNRCTSLNSITLPDGVTSIGNDAFSNCTALTVVTIPVEMKTVGQYAFYNCKNLWHVLYKGNALQWNKISVATQNTPLTDATRHFLCTGDEVTDPVNKICQLCCSHDYVNRICTVCGLINWPLNGSCGDDLTWTLTEEGVLTISGTGPMTDYESGTTPWYVCRTSIKVIVIESGATTIGRNAFADLTGVTDITIPGSIYSIDDSAFRNCENISGIWVDEENEYFLSDTFGVLFDKEMTTLIQAPSSISGCYIIADGVITVREDAFRNCTDLQALVIPQSLTSIGDRAFANCQNLWHVLYTGTELQDGVYMGENNDPLMTATWHYNCTGKEIVNGACTICTPIATGDADGDGFVDAFDASQIMKYSVGAITADELNVAQLDVDGDGYVDAFDAALIQKYSVGMIDKFPIEE